MNRLFRGRHLGVLATLLAGALLVPVYANRPTGAADNFAVLAGLDVDVSGAGDVDVSNGNVGAVGAINDAGANLNVTGEGTTTSQLEAQNALTQLNNGITFVQTQLAPTGVTVPSGDLAAQNVGAGVGIYPPGTYTIAGPAAIGAGGITLDATAGGASDLQAIWIFIIRNDGMSTGSLEVDGAITLANGANAGNVAFLAEGGVDLDAGAPLNGLFVAGDADSVAGINVESGLTINGKLLANGDVTFANAGGITVNDPVVGSAPVLAADPVTPAYTVNPGQTINIGLTAIDPDGGDITLSADLDNLPSPPAFGVVSDTDGNVSQTFSYNVPDVPGNYVAQFFSTDGEGLICRVDIPIRINTEPGLIADQSSPLDICPGDPVTINLTADDPDNDAPVNITASGLPAGATFNATAGDPATATFSLTGAQTELLDGQTFNLQFTATDALGETTTSTIVLNVETDPVIAVSQLSPDTGSPTSGSSVTVCVGETLTFDVSASDPDASDLVSLFVTGTPVGATHAPNFFGDDDGLDPAGDTLVLDANPATSRFTWTPDASDVTTGGTPITLVYTARDDTGCEEVFTLEVQVTNAPTLSATANGVAVANGGTVTLCPSPGPDNTTTLVLTGDDVEAGNVTLAQTSTPFPGSITVTGGSLPNTGDPAGATLLITAPTEAQVQADGDPDRTYPQTFTVTDAEGCVTTLTVNVRIDTAPVVQASVTNLGVLCVGQTVNYTITASDADAGDTINLEQTPAVPGVSHGVSLPSAGNPLTVNATFTPQTVGTFNITYVATDSAGCTGTVTVTATVEERFPTQLFLFREPEGSAVQVDEEVCYTALVLDQCGDPFPGATVLFDIEGEPGIDPDNGSGPFPTGSKGGGFVDVDASVTTDANGEAVFCYTPRFPTSQAITVTACIDQDNDGQCDPGEPEQSDSFVVDIPISQANCAISGDGAVLVGSRTIRGGRVVPVRGFFHLGVNGTELGGRGAANFTIVGEVDLPEGVPGDLGRTFKARLTQISAVTCSEYLDGRVASIFGTARTSAYGPVPARVDVLDAGTPGVGSDRFQISLLTPDGEISLGSTLVKPGRGKNDIKIRVGVSRRR